MKKAFVLYFLFITAISANAQLLNETFDTSCIASPIPGIPSGWEEINITANQTSNANLDWQCTPDGENNTPGVLCTGIINNTLYLDTAYLFTPNLHLIGVTGPLYFQFDAKYVGVNHNILSVLRTTDSIPGTIDTFQDFTNEVFDDSTSISGSGSSFINPENNTWKTYQIDITSFEGAYVNLYMAFRYTSDTDSSGTWTIDNVKLTDTLLDTASHLAVSNVIQTQSLPLTVIGPAQPDNITLSYQVKQAGNYTLALYDMVGRQLYSKDIYTDNSQHTLQIDNLHLSRGMYIVKMGDGQCYGVTKAMVE